MEILLATELLASNLVAPFCFGLYILRRSVSALPSLIIVYSSKHDCLGPVASKASVVVRVRARAASLASVASVVAGSVASVVVAAFKGSPVVAVASLFKVKS